MSLRYLYVILCLSSFIVNAESINISHFANSSLDGWQHKSFKAYTQYQIVSLNKQSVLRAEGTDVASSLYKKIRIDLEKTPYLNWSWRVDAPLTINDERSKPGDDFAARIYLIVEGKWFFWQTRAINYVWASHSQKNEAWANPFAGNNVMMVAVRSKTDQTKHWYTEKRNIRTDFKKHFADDIRFIDATAIMSDTDNSAGSVLSYYANIYFSEQ